jgi:hypothetical protein
LETKKEEASTLMDASFEAFTGVMFQVEVFWVVTPCSVVVGYQNFRSPWCLHLQGEVYDKTLVSYHNTEDHNLYNTGNYNKQK